MRGRPKQEVTRSAKILIRLFPREKKLIRDIAKEYGMSISDFIRAALLNQEYPRLEDEEELHGTES